MRQDGCRRDTPPDGGRYQECGSALETDRLAVGAILDDDRPSADTFGILVFDNSPNQRAGIQMVEL